MFKLIRKKIVEGLIKDLINELPSFKTAARTLFDSHKDELIEKVKNAILEAIKDFVQKKLG